jgi:hypothetical protein
MKEGQMTKRIQRRRTPGWRQPADAIYVGRPTNWGNPYYIGTGMYNQVNVLPTNDREFDKKEAVRLMEEFQARHPSLKVWRSHPSWSFFRFDITDAYSAALAYRLSANWNSEELKPIARQGSCLLVPAGPAVSR